MANIPQDDPIREFGVPDFGKIIEDLKQQLPTDALQDLKETIEETYKKWSSEEAYDIPLSFIHTVKHLASLGILYHLPFPYNYMVRQMIVEPIADRLATTRNEKLTKEKDERAPEIKAQMPGPFIPIKKDTNQEKFNGFYTQDKRPHVLVGGYTDSGKTTLIQMYLTKGLIPEFKEPAFFKADSFYFVGKDGFDRQKLEEWFMCCAACRASKHNEFENMAGKCKFYFIPYSKLNVLVTILEKDKDDKLVIFDDFQQSTEAQKWVDDNIIQIRHAKAQMIVFAQQLTNANFVQKIRNNCMYYVLMNESLQNLKTILKDKFPKDTIQDAYNRLQLNSSIYTRGMIIDITKKEIFYVEQPCLLINPVIGHKKEEAEKRPHDKDESENEFSKIAKLFKRD
jgi:hypothetical protein